MTTRSCIDLEQMCQSSDLTVLFVVNESFNRLRCVLVTVAVVP